MSHHVSVQGGASARKRLGWLGCSLILVSPLARATNPAMPGKLAGECRAGKAESWQKLAQIAREDRDCDLRRVAVDLLADQAVLAEIATGSGLACGGQVVRAVLDRLTDQAALATKVKKNLNYNARFAMKNLTDQALLADIAKTGSAGDVLTREIRRQAAQKLTDQAALADVAKGAGDPYIRMAALRKVTSQTALADLARNASDGDVRLEAAERLTDKGMAQSIYAEMAKTAGDSGVRDAAAGRLSDLSGLARSESPTGNPFEMRVVSATYRDVRCQLSQFNVVYSASGWGITTIVHNPTDAEVTADISPGLQMVDAEGKKHSVPDGFWSSSACSNRGIDHESLGMFHVAKNGFTLDYTRPEGDKTARMTGSLTGVWDEAAKWGRAWLRLSPHESVKILFVFDASPECKPKSLLWPDKLPVPMPKD